MLGGRIVPFLLVPRKKKKRCQCVKKWNYDCSVIHIVYSYEKKEDDIVFAFLQVPRRLIGVIHCVFQCCLLILSGERFDGGVVAMITMREQLHCMSGSPCCYKEASFVRFRGQGGDCGLFFSPEISGCDSLLWHRMNKLDV